MHKTVPMVMQCQQERDYISKTTILQCWFVYM